MIAAPAGATGGGRGGVVGGPARDEEDLAGGPTGLRDAGADVAAGRAMGPVVPGLPGSDPSIGADPPSPPAPPADGGDGDRWDEDEPEQVPGSFLEALPQFFVFPLILVATLAGVYLMLRMLTGVGDVSAPEMLAKIRSAPGQHGRWQALHGLAQALREERITLDAVPASDLAALYEALAPEGPLVRSYMLRVLAYKSDPTFASLAEEALQDEDPDVRLGALYALKQLAQSSSVPALAAVVGSGGVWEERFLALGALAEIGNAEARGVLLERVSSDNGLEHRNAVLGLALNGDTRALDWLAPMLARQSYANDASLLGDGLASASEDSRLAARGHVVDQFLINACRAAEALGDRTLVPDLQALRRNDASTKVQSAALNALAALGADG